MSLRWVARVEIRVLNSVEIMRAIVDRIGCKLNVFNEDGVYRKDSVLEPTTLRENHQPHTVLSPLTAAQSPGHEERLESSHVSEEDLAALGDHLLPRPGVSNPPLH